MNTLPQPNSSSFSGQSPHPSHTADSGTHLGPEVHENSSSAHSKNKTTLLSISHIMILKKLLCSPKNRCRLNCFFLKQKILRLSRAECSQQQLIHNTPQPATNSQASPTKNGWDTSRPNMHPSTTTTSWPPLSWRRTEYTVRNVETTPALFRALSLPQNIYYTWLYPHVYLTILLQFQLKYSVCLLRKQQQNVVSIFKGTVRF